MITDNWRIKLDPISELNSEEFQDLLFLHHLIIVGSNVFFTNKKMIHVNVPVTTGAASSPMGLGSDSSPVEALINGNKVLLTDSAQFYLEYACRAYSNGCFYYGHSFRDEEPDNRHLSQFSHVECEIVGSLSEIKSLVFEYIKYITLFIWKNIDKKYRNDEKLKSRVAALNKKSEFETIKYQDACDYLKNFDGALKLCADKYKCITSLGEKLLINKFGEFIWLENWDKMLVPFYQAVNNDNGLAQNADLLFGIGEVVGLGQRHYKAADLLKSLEEHKIDPSSYKWYIDLKQIYPLQTSGFGMGVERYLMWFLGINDIRNVELFMRNKSQIGKF